MDKKPQRRFEGLQKWDLANFRLLKNDQNFFYSFQKSI